MGEGVVGEGGHIVQSFDGNSHLPIRSSGMALGNMSGGLAVGTSMMEGGSDG